MKNTQIESNVEDNNDLLRAAGVKRIHKGWYTIWFNGVRLDCSTAAKAKRNPKGEIAYND